MASSGSRANNSNEFLPDWSHCWNFSPAWFSSLQPPDAELDSHKRQTTIQTLDSGAAAYIKCKELVTEIFQAFDRHRDNPGRQADDDAKLHQLGVKLLGIYEGASGRVVNRFDHGTAEKLYWEMFLVFILVIYALGKPEPIRDPRIILGLKHLVACTTRNGPIMSHLRNVDSWHEQAAVNAAIHGPRSSPNGTPHHLMVFDLLSYTKDLRTTVQEALDELQ